MGMGVGFTSPTGFYFDNIQTTLDTLIKFITMSSFSQAVFFPKMVAIPPAKYWL